ALKRDLLPLHRRTIARRSWDDSVTHRRAGASSVSRRVPTAGDRPSLPRERWLAGNRRLGRPVHVARSAQQRDVGFQATTWKCSRGPEQEDQVEARDEQGHAPQPPGSGERSRRAGQYSANLLWQRLLDPGVL